MAGAQSLYVGTYNIRYQNSDDEKNGDGWKNRCPVVCGQLNFEHPDIFGTQEVLEPQLHDMLRLLDEGDFQLCPGRAVSGDDAGGIAPVDNDIIDDILGQGGEWQDECGQEGQKFLHI